MSQAASNISVGVEALLKKLQEEGVTRGQSEADQIVANAKIQAQEIIDSAKEEASSLVSHAKKEADFIKNAGKDALNMAARNIMLELQSNLVEKFSQKIRAIVTDEMKDETLLQKIIVEVAGQSGITAEKNIEVILPKNVIGVEDLRLHPEKLKEGQLTAFVAQHGSDLLKEGVTFVVDEQQQTGITFCLKDKDIQVTMDEHAVSEVLLKHLQPRFRALLEGIIH